MTSIQQQIQALDANIAAINAQITSLTTMQSTATEVPEVLSYTNGANSTTFLGPAQIAKSIADLTKSLLLLQDQRFRLTQSSGTGIRRAGVSR